MADLVVVTTQSSADGLPPALTLLPHAVELVTDAADQLSMIDADVVVIDARSELSRARDACVAVRTRSSMPILLLASTQTLSVVQPNWGADDFVLETAEAAEFEARIRLLTQSRRTSSLIEAGPIQIDEEGYTVTVGGHSLDLTYTEFELLKYLAVHPGRVLTREHLLSEVWGYDYYGGTRTVDVHVRRLRAKLGPEYEGHVTTVRNVGYRFSPVR
ncbi:MULTISPECIES: response regulator transcription factor [Aestuariimicrobium]|uniref:response regulator transcription factor n=1 Tax=Aestuariimicrobium TaxID=396388 RepID=UPI0004204CDF|nr:MULTISPECIES: response regulator transcription factor [Aestuariimicrobium]CAI9405368.1 Sensory transduction protein regX3 [Aestuariimicrobium sp. T2.26MG-19.2B]